MEDTAQLASGSLFLHAIDFLKSKKGAAAVDALEKEQGAMLFDSHKMYPLAQLNTLQQEVLTRTFGLPTEEAYHALGQFTFDAFVHEMIGATLTNVTPTPKVLLGKIQDIWGSVVNFGTRKLTSVDEKKGRATIEIKDDSREPAYLQGIIEAGLPMMHLSDAHTRVVGKRKGTYQIEISWKP